MLATPPSYSGAHAYTQWGDSNLHPLLNNVIRAPLEPASRLFWGWLAGALVLAAVVWFTGERRRHSRGFCGWLLDGRRWRHRSTAVDLQVGLARLALAPSRWLATWVGVPLAAHATALFLDASLGPQDLGEFTAPIAAVYALVLLLANDLAMYINHRLHHAVPVLWRFHALHHSAEVLTPLTTLRHHPVYDVSRSLLRAGIAGPVVGVVAWIWTGAAEPLQILGVNALHVAFLASTANLRHSHVPLRFGPVLGRIFSSPSQHQLHHSAAPEHYDRNFGTVFAVWDTLFGTLHLPRGDESITLGLADEAPHRNLFDAWLRPFSEAARLILDRGDRS
jgi:sterol desaturase/sphingolipid hydroxylase (fatty acid hydroxylase superfamily)